MKNWMYICLSVALIACQNQEDKMSVSSNGAGKTYTLGFELGGEYADISQAPLPKSEVKENKDLYWMEVWCSEKDKDNFSFYGKGVFDHPDSIKVEFKDGYKYRIQMAYVKEGKEKIWKDIATRGYLEPLSQNSGYYEHDYEYCICNNHFIITTTRGHFTTTCEFVNLQGEGNNRQGTRSELTGRYYGRMDNFIPEENAKIALEMYKVAYGIQIKVNGLTDGILNVRYNMGDDINLNFSATDGNIQQRKINELQWAGGLRSNINNIATVMNNKEGERVVLEECKFYFTWTNGNGLVTLNIGEKGFWLERNKMNIITVNLSKLPSVHNGAIFEFETTPMIDKEAGNMEGAIE